MEYLNGPTGWPTSTSCVITNCEIESTLNFSVLQIFQLRNSQMLYR